MRINTLSVTNFKGFDNRVFQFHPEFNLIVGVNGKGKTSALDALAVAAGSWFLGLRGYDSRHIWPTEIRLAAKDFNGEIRFESQFPVEVTAKGVVDGQELTWTRSVDSAGGKTRFMHASNVKAIAASADHSVRAGEPITLPLISYYGTGRLWQEPRADSQVKDSHQLARKKTLSRLEGYKNSVDPRLSTRDLAVWIARQSWIGYQQGKDSPLYAAVREAILNCVEDAQQLYFDPKRGEVIVVMGDLGAQPFFNLSDGQRCMVAMVGDIAQKAAQLNPHLGSDVLKKTPGLVLIDELDLHLHPRWQRRLVEDLRRTFPSIQFICTTHSPFLIQSLRSGEELIMLDGQPTAQLANRPIADIAKGIMGVPETEFGQRYSDMVKEAKNFLEDLEKSTLTDAQKLEEFKKRLAEGVAPFADNPAYQAFLELRLAGKIGG